MGLQFERDDAHGRNDISRLRQKIEKDAEVPTILVTEPGGYKLVPSSRSAAFPGPARGSA